MSETPPAESDATRANIRTARGDHRRNCLGMPYELSKWAWEGDVRRCEHGRTLIAHDVPGYGSACWFDLSPVLNPINYWRARRVTSPGVTP